MVRTYMSKPVSDQILLLKRTYRCKNQEERQLELVHFKIHDHDFYPYYLVRRLHAKPDTLAIFI